MFGNIEKLDEMKKKLNSVSPSFCLAKWKHVTIHLMTGKTHSCYLPLPHKIPLDEIKNNPSALHNTSFKKLSRKQMLKGERPKECSICWSIEDLNRDDLYSDRYYRGVDDWTMPFFDEIKNLKGDEDVYPSYLEVSFSSSCNFKCMYCSPAISTAWLKEVKEHGPIKLTSGDHNSLQWLKKNNEIPLEEDDNPYLKAFWDWWPELVKNLQYFRVTGGEPLLSPSTFKLLTWLKENPQDKLELSINSNLGIPDKQFNKFLPMIEDLFNERCLKGFILHTSLDTWGPQAEYIRTGLELHNFQKNVERYLEEVPNGSLAFMCTFNILSPFYFISFLEYILSLRKVYNSEKREILLDIPHLQAPEFFSAKILPKEFYKYFDEILSYMKQREEPRYGIKKAEIQKMERIYDWVKSVEVDSEFKEIKKLRSDFVSYVENHDKRRGTQFNSIFPEMKAFMKDNRSRGRLGQFLKGKILS